LIAKSNPVVAGLNVPKDDGFTIYSKKKCKNCPFSQNLNTAKSSHYGRQYALRKQGSTSKLTANSDQFSAQESLGAEVCVSSYFASTFPPSIWISYLIYVILFCSINSCILFETARVGFSRALEPFVSYMCATIHI